MLIRNPVQSAPAATKPKLDKPVGQLFMKGLEPEKPKRAGRALVDDSLAVAKLMEELFSQYKDSYKLVTTEQELIEYMSTRPELGLDTETTGLNRYLDKIAGFSLGSADDCIYVPLNHEKGTNYQGDRENLPKILNANGRKYWGMNTKFDRGFLRYHCGFDVEMKWDAEIAARLLDNRDSAALKFQYVKYVDPNAKFYEFGGLFKRSFTFYDPAVVGIYAGVDSIKHLKLGMHQKKVMEEHFPKIYKLMLNVELPLVDVVLGMELRGIMIDVEYYAKFTAELRSEMDSIMLDLNKDFPNFNPNSFKQVGEVLFDRLRLPDPSKSRKTGEEWLEKINHPVVDKILEVRKIRKAISTYTEAIPNLAIPDENGYPIVHTTYHTVGTNTGRFSSSDPNLQNQPRDNRFRRGFIARPGYKLVSVDFSQQEQAVLAGVSRDPKMLEGAERGQDFYVLMASIIWGLPYEDCTKHGKMGHLRNQCKAIVLGVTYDMSAKSLAESLNSNSNSDHVYTVEECENILDKFYSGFPVVKQFQEWCHTFATENGYMETVLGRRRYFNYLGKPAFECPTHPEVADTLNSLKYYNQIRACMDEAKSRGITVIDNRWRQGDELRQTTNACVQGSAADGTKVCMLQLHRDKTFTDTFGGFLLLQVHDELIAEIPSDLAEEGGKYMAQVMSDTHTALTFARVRAEPLVMDYWEKD